MSGDGAGEDGRPVVSAKSLEIVAALFAIGFGAVIILGALEHSIGWGERGPEPGAFPFWTGLVVVGGGLGALATAVLDRHRSDRPPGGVTRAQAHRIVAFLLPVVGFLVLALVLKLGLYVAMAVYLLVVMVVQGKYKLSASLAVSVGSALFFYLIFDRWLRVPLMKGPLEAWLGLH